MAKAKKNMEKYRGLFGQSLVELRKYQDELPGEFLDAYVIYTTYFHQYAPGCTGAVRKFRLYVSEQGLGYPYAAAAHKDAKEHGLFPYTKKGRDTEYGELGAKQFTRTAITIREALELDTPVWELKPIRKKRRR